MEILYFDEINSTHIFLEERVRSGNLKPPIAIVANKQLSGVGSGKNSWLSLDGNLFLSFCLSLDKLPYDLPVQSSSIYFSYIMKELLVELGSSVWLKWPNDFYIDDKKIGGTITKLILGKYLICSMGLNLKSSPENFNIIDINIEKNRLLELYFLKLKQDILWKNIFSNYEIEFVKSKSYSYYDKVQSKKVSLKDAKLNEDGSIIIKNRKVYSLR